MLGKLLVLLVLLAFAAMAFIAGMLAPPSLQQPVQVLVQTQVAALLRPTGLSAASGGTAGGGSSASGGTSAAVPAKALTAGIAASAAVATPAGSAASASSWSQVLLPASSPDPGARFGLLVAQFANADLAQAMGERLKAMGLPQQIVTVDDAQGQRWSLVVLGSFANVDAAMAQRAAVAAQLGVSTALRVIVLPAKG